MSKPLPAHLTRSSAGLLRPCPFCASLDVTLNEDPDASGDAEVWVECENCQAIGPRTRIGCRDDEDDDYVHFDGASWSMAARVFAEYHKPATDCRATWSPTISERGGTYAKIYRRLRAQTGGKR